MNHSLIKNNISLRYIALILLFMLLTLLMETIFHAPIKLPGHRAFPGAFTLLLVAEAFIPVLVIFFAFSMPAILIATGHAQPTIVLAWALPALACIGMTNYRYRGHVVYFICGGVLFGLLRFLSLEHGLHHTPDLIRISGHLLFGGFAGASAYSVNTLTRSKDNEID